MQTLHTQTELDQEFTDSHIILLSHHFDSDSFGSQIVEYEIHTDEEINQFISEDHLPNALRNKIEGIL